MVNLTYIPKNRDGSSFYVEIDDKTIELNVKLILLKCLDTPLRSDESLTLKDKRKLAELGDKIYEANEEIQLSDTEKEDLIERCHQVFLSFRLINEIVKALS